MNPSRPLSRHDDIPVAIARIAATGNKSKDGAVITDQHILSMGHGEACELDAVAHFGTDLTKATLYTTRQPDDTVMKFLEKCGLRRIVIMDDGKPDPQHQRTLFADYVGPCTYRVRDMLKGLEQHR